MPGVYEAKLVENGIETLVTMDFKPDGKVILTFAAPNARQEATLTYTEDGDRITVYPVKGDHSSLFVRTGDVLEGDVHFTGVKTVRLARQGSAASGQTGVISGATLPRAAKPPTGKPSQNESFQSDRKLMKIGQAVLEYGMKNSNKSPASLHELVQSGKLTADDLQSPCGPVADGKQDYWVRLDDQIFGMDSTLMMAYDRAAYARGGPISVLFCDAHVERLPMQQFDAMLKNPKNSGKDFQLPPPQ
ncbi:MAG: hypothetical protein KIT24_06675 [Phycisphaeraceae bacterium]|nr:hypothetical protein [Phycisphaeraceae bacterium]